MTSHDCKQDAKICRDNQLSEEAMAQYRTIKTGAEESRVGIGMSAMISLTESMAAAGLDTSSLSNAQHALIVEDGVRLDLARSSAGCLSLFCSAGLAILMPPGTVASVERKDGSEIHMRSGISGGYDANKVRPYSEALSFSEEQADPRAIEWLRTGERGSSSLALSSLFFGLPERSVVDDAPAPRDASDLRRCVLFLEQTGTTGRIGEAAAMSPAWAAIAPRWEELVELLALAMAEEAPSQSSRAINAILQDADAPRPRASQGPK